MEDSFTIATVILGLVLSCLSIGISVWQCEFRQHAATDVTATMHPAPAELHALAHVAPSSAGSDDGHAHSPHLVQ